MNPYSVKQVAAAIDHAVLKPNQTEMDLRQAAKLCMKHSVSSMCVRPSDVRLTAELLHDSAVVVSTVVSFPHGNDTCATKEFQSEQAIENGAQELDMVLNISRLLSRDYDYVRNEIERVVRIAHARGALVKVIQESCFLTLEEVASACLLTRDAGADFVKTSTGFGPSSATPEIIDVMVKTVGGTMGIKASGGIRTWDQAVGYLQQGATRLGMGATQAVLEGCVSSDDY